MSFELKLKAFGYVVLKLNDLNKKIRDCSTVGRKIVWLRWCVGNEWVDANIVAGRVQTYVFNSVCVFDDVTACFNFFGMGGPM